DRALLLRRRTVRRAARPQHFVLEVDARFRSHYCAGQGEHSAPRTAADHLRHNRRNTMDDVPDQYCGRARQRSERRNPLEQRLATANVADAALPSARDPRAVVCPVLRLAAADIGLGPPRADSLGDIAAAGDWHL